MRAAATAESTPPDKAASTRIRTPSTAPWRRVYAHAEGLQRGGTGTAGGHRVSSARPIKNATRHRTKGNNA